MDAIITLTGNLGADPRIRTVGPDQTPVTEFNIAHTPRVRRGEEWKDGTTTWYRITCWRRLAENVVGSLRRGDGIIVTGRLRPTEWIDKNGVIQRTEEVDAITVGPDLSRGRAYVVRSSPRSAGSTGQDSVEVSGAYAPEADPEAMETDDPDYPEQDAYAPETEAAAERETGAYDRAAA